MQSWLRCNGTCFKLCVLHDLRRFADCCTVTARSSEQQERRERGGSGFDVLPVDTGAHRGSHDTGDPCTTNLYVGNLAPTLDEHTLKLAFGKYGPIASIKIMWPRDDEQRTGGRMSGFVAYMSRRSAEEALESLQGMVLHNAELRLGWSKAVQLPAVPCWPPPSGYEPGFSTAGAVTLAHEPLHHAALPPRIDVRLPRTAARLHLVDTLASYVLLDGTTFENLICAREHGNPDFAFLRDQTSEEYLYYKWRVYSLAQGDSLAHWREQEFQMVQGGSVWVPPKIEDLRHVVASGPGVDASAVAPVTVELTEEQRDAFEDILRSLTVERGSIRTAMLFALDHAAAAAEISDTLVQALTLRETPVAVKVARLFLLSDVLHNSNASPSNAAAYRSHLISRLPLVFESLHDAYSALDSRITAQEFRRRVTAVLRAWADWFMFGQHFLGGLEATFVGLRSSAAARLADDPALRATLEALSDEDLERRCSDNGLSTLAGRDSCIGRLIALDCFRRAQSGELPCAEEHNEGAHEPAVPAERGTWTVVSEPPASRWTTSDAAPGREPDSSRKRSRSPPGAADGSAPRHSPRQRAS